MARHLIRLASCALLALGSSAALAADPIRLGVPLPLTGTTADEGMKEQQGIDMCIDAVNAKGGVKVGPATRKLEAVKYDYQGETSRAVQIVQRLVGGRGNRTIAAALAISVKAVEVHRAAIMRKLGLTSPPDLVRFAVRNRIVEP